MCAMRRAYRRGVSTLQYTGRLETQRRCMAMLPYIYNTPAVAECAKKNPTQKTPRRLHTSTTRFHKQNTVSILCSSAFIYFVFICLFCRNLSDVSSETGFVRK